MYNYPDSLKSLIATRGEAQKAVFVATEAINKFDDGFWYCVRVSSFGSHYMHNYTNYYAAELDANEYNGNNGVSTIYSNNPDCDAVYISSRKALDTWLGRQELLNSKSNYPQYWDDEDQAMLDAVGDIEEPKFPDYPNED